MKTDNEELDEALLANLTDDDDIEEGASSYAPDAQAIAWYNQQVSGLKKAQARALASKKKESERANKAESALLTAQEDLQAMKDALGDSANDPSGLAERLRKLREFETGALKASDIDENEILERGRKGAERKAELDYGPKIKLKDRQLAELTAERDALKSELHTYKYTGRLKGALTGVVKQGYDRVALAAMRDLTRVNDDGDLECFDTDGELAIDTNGTPMSPEEFAADVFRKRYPDLCIKDTTLPTNGTPTPMRPKEKNPWLKESRNRTMQAQIIKNDPERARKLIKAAGEETAKYNL